MGVKRLLLIVGLISLYGLGAAGSSEPVRPDSEGLSIGHNLRYDLGVELAGGEPVVVEFMVQTDYQDIYQRLADDYMALHPNVDIRITSLAFGPLKTRLRSAIPAGVGPDIFHLHNSFVLELIPHMEPYPEDVFPIARLEADFMQTRSQLINGRIYFLELGMLTGAIFYNTDHWAQAGLDEDDIPQTWDQLAELARLLTQYDEEGNVVRSGFNPNGSGYSLFTALNLQQGQTMFSLENPRQPLIDSPISQRSLEYLLQFYGPEPTVSVNLPESNESFAFGTSSMMYSWGWAINWLNQRSANLNFGTFPVPSWDGETPPAWDRNNGEISMGVNRKSDPIVQEVAFDFIRFYLASDEYLRRVSERFGAFPSKFSVQRSLNLNSNPLYSSFASILDRTIWPGFVPDIYEDYIVSYLVEPVILDGAEIPTALSAAQRVLEPLMRFEGFFSAEDLYAHIDDFVQ